MSKPFESKSIVSIPKRKVPFFNYPDIYLNDEQELLAIMKDVGSRGAFIMQSDLYEFEVELAAYTGAKYAVGVGSATDGLHFGLVAGGIKAGDEVIICTHTMMATAAAIHFAGGVAVPIEVGSDRLLDIAAIESAITPKTRAIMPTQLNGRTANMDAILALCEKHGLLLFEDAAQALGSQWKGQSAGTFGIASAISFYPAKTLGCLGDGGAVLTNDENVYEKVKMLRDFGRNAAGEYEMWAMNSRLDNLQAAVLKFKLQAYPSVVNRRREIAGQYHRRLGELAALDLPPAPDDSADHFDVYQNYEIVADHRDELKVFLEKCGVGTLIQWSGHAVHHQKKLGFSQKLPRSDKFFEGCLMLPLNMSLSNADIDYVCDSVQEFYADV